MKIDNFRFFRYLRQLKKQSRYNGTTFQHTFNEPPLRAELFSADQMEQHGKRLAAAHTLSPKCPHDQLLTRLAHNEALLVSVCDRVTAAVKTNRQITPSSEWLIDNFYLIEEQIRTAKRHLPKGYSRELPILLNGPSAGLPRLYDIALEIITHGDGRVNPESLNRFVAAYQTVSVLKLGELWAIPIMLRLTLIENLRRVAICIDAGHTDRELAAVWAEKMIAVAEEDPKSLVLIIADMARTHPPMSTAFISEFTRRIQGQSLALALPLTWIEQVLDESGLTIEQLVQSENQQQAADQVSISNSITSLRSLSGTDWREFVETMSVVEQTLRKDPDGTYPAMDFSTRDRYRHVIEKIAKASLLSEADIALRAIQLARTVRQGDDNRMAHVGFYLIDQGLPSLETLAHVPFSLKKTLAKIGSKHQLSLYLGAITVLMLCFSMGLLVITRAQGMPNQMQLPLGLLALLATGQMALALVNWLATLLINPHPLPRMDSSMGISAQSRTLAVVPTMLIDPQAIDDLVEALEVRFLANRDANLYFGLLTDFKDADKETLDEDDSLLRQAQTRIEALNTKYGTVDNNIFFLFHRPRRWNPQERLWMGYERKRGKLSDLNALLRGNAGDRFSHIAGNIKHLIHIKYVITLDTDTQLPRDVARQFVGVMTHPLNHARYNTALRRVDAGYGILQPAVSASLESTNRSHYTKLHGFDAGIDPYTRAISNVYQDVFGEGSFIGKGIYEVDIFEQALNGRFPENRILSHDLLEGCYARTGLLSDVHLYEDYPAHYSADVSRRHRWIRGDWQLLGWLLPRVRSLDNLWQKNPLSWLSRWKLFDNLRRSLVSTTLILLLLLGWALLAPSWLWTLSVLGILLVPPLIASVFELFRKPHEMLFSQHVIAIRDAGIQSLAQTAFTLACLPYEACFSLDAILRTMVRMVFTHRQMLEWNPSGEAERNNRTDFVAYLHTMWVAPLIAVSTILYLLVFKPAALITALPVLLLWLGSPALVWWISQPVVRREARLTAQQITFLRELSRKTWAFFETFVSLEDNWLPPDNYQEFRGGGVAHRTSPTNMGLALLANLTAYDFGYIPAGQLIERTTNTLHTMGGLERHRGHFYNWYNTVSLKPLHPHYVSTVDSGNLAGHLLTLRPGLLSLADNAILSKQVFNGLRDTLEVLMEAAANTPLALLAQFQTDFNAACTSRTNSLAQTYLCLDGLTKRTLAFADNLDAILLPPEKIGTQMSMGTEKNTGTAGLDLQVDQILKVTSTKAREDALRLPIMDATPATHSETASDNDASWWARALARQCRAALDELTFLAPWLLLPTVPGGLSNFLDINEIPTLRDLEKLEEKMLPIIEQRMGIAAEREWLLEFKRCLATAAKRATKRIAATEKLAGQANEFARMEYGFLYDKVLRLLTIGYNVNELRCDASYYDLLASEARLTNFIAIAQGQVPQESWFALGRILTNAGGEPILLSWSGSMFEYLMPLLVMPTFHNTLLDQTCKAAVERQIEYGRQRGVPWGMSESGYNLVDIHLNYQYRAFGVPGLGLKRGLADDLVIAPYASALALMVAPEAACLNLQRLSTKGLGGKFGLYEAIDYTPSRQWRRESSTVVRSYMAHHQGMSLLSLSYLLLDRPMQRRFESEPAFQATLLLLQERIPKATALFSHIAQLSDIRPASGTPEATVRIFNTPNTPIPEVQLLSNGRYHVMVTNAGGGYSRWKDLAVTRWREDATSDQWGMFCYLRDMDSGEVWSTAYQPTLKQPQHYEAIFSEGRAEFRRRDFDYETHTEIVVSPEDDIELRRVHLTNHALTRRTITVTSYAEVVLALPAADESHPAFSNLFVQTEVIKPRQAILCTRRPRSHSEQVPWMAHLMAAHGADIEEISYETDRMQFIGRGCTTAGPQALSGAPTSSKALSGSQGAVLDPIVAIRFTITLDPQQTVTIDMVTGMGENREAVLSLAEKYQDRQLADRVFELAWTHAQVVLRQINASNADAQLYGQLASSVVYANASLRANASTLIQNRRGQSSLWGYAISGDLPIVLLQIGDAANIELVRQLVQAHAYWRLKGLAVDLVIWNEDRAGYRQLLQDQITGLIAAGIEAHAIARPGGIFMRSTEQISNEDRILFQSVARVVISDSWGTLAEQLNRRRLKEVRTPHLKPTRTHRAESPANTLSLQRDLILRNGLGGFTPDGHEYVITTTAGHVTPAPWVNVLANPHFGTVISENGLAYTWSKNAHEFRLTPWHNDPVSDASGEAFYLRDEESGHFWSPTPLPSRGANDYVSRHGFGYSVFEHNEGGITSELWVYVALDMAVKFSVLKVRNISGRPRRLSATGYVEWVLGDLRPKSTMHVTTELDSGSGALFAHNPYNTEFADQVAFFDVDDASRTFSCDRTEFIGRNGSLKNPAAMTRARLSGKIGAALDPCAAIQVSFDLIDGQEREIVFRLGQAGKRGTDDTSKLVRSLRGSATAYTALQAVWQYWNHTLGAVQVETPDASLNVLTNGWLVYQTLACRLWARSGYYQSGGAFGFRDQLQDVMALIHAEPQRVREHLLLCAAHQFVEGDVQHWWHPPSNRGVRTRCSDDYLWLPLAVCRYVHCTGDTGVLDESTHFLEGRAVNPEDDSYYDLPGQSTEMASLYQHCVRAIRHGLRFGERGLPLMGSGDWNDGMNLVGIHGKGESVWLGFFLYDVLTRFTGLARQMGDEPFAEMCRTEAEQLRQRIEQNAWDGGWYRRAYFDDGAPLGSVSNTECQIDSISQSWSVLSGAGDAARSRMGMDAVYARLVKHDDALIQLLDPPFDTSDMDPGYIKGYVPGVRENGGQYTQAAIWTAMAFAALGDSQRAWELLTMINPVNHAKTATDITTYKIEPYVVAADVYAVEPHAGRGGWSWYTGSAGWMYRLIVESLLGLRLEVDKLHFVPCLPADWKSFKLHYRYRETVYHIVVTQTDTADAMQNSAMHVTVDGAECPDAIIQLIDDRQDHAVEVKIFAPSTDASSPIK